MIDRHDFDRRHLLGLAARGAFAASAISLPVLAQAAREPRAADGRLLFDVRQFGAVGDGQIMNTLAIQTAIDAAAAARGGLVYLPPGDYLSGTIILKSNVTLYLEAGATLIASPRLADWQAFPFPHGGSERHLVYADDATQIGLMGPGRIHGSAEHFRKPRDPGEKPGFGDRMEGGRIAAAYVKPTGPRPDAMICFRRCTGVRIYDVLLTSPPNWTLHPVNCDSVFIRNITIRNPPEGPNSDGIDPDGCSNVVISDCNVSTGDDGICIKNRDQLGLGRVSRHVTVTNCTVESNCNALKIDEVTGAAGFENISFSNCVLHCPAEPDEYRTISGIHVDVGGGGEIDGVSFSNINMSQVRNAIFLRSHTRNWSSRHAGPPGRLRNVSIDNVFARGQTLTSAIAGLEEAPIENVRLSNIHLMSREKGEAELVDRPVPELPADYPEVTMFRRLPSYGLYARHVKGLSMHHVRMELESTDMRPALYAEDVQELDIDTFAYSVCGNKQPAVRLRNTSRVFVRGCRAVEGTTMFLALEGARTAAVSVIGNDFGEAQTSVQLAPEIASGALFESSNRPPGGS